jgi:MFS family permease
MANKKKLTKKEAEKKEFKRIRTLKQKSRNLSISEGIFYSAENAFGNQYISPFAIAINAGNSLVAMLSAITGLLNPLTQIFSSKMIEKNSRKKIVSKSFLIESFMWISFILLGILFYKNIIPSIIPGLFLFFFAILIITIGFPAPAWTSWLGDIINESHRGRWFSKRNLLIGFSSFILIVGSGFFLDYMKQNNYTIIGFCILFFFAFLARLKCSKIVKKMYEPKIELKEPKNEKPFSFWSFIKSSPETNFGKFTIFRSMFGLAVAIYSSLIAIYLLRNLNLSYIHYVLIISSEIIFSVLVIEIWGKIADKYGNYKVLALSTILIPIIPILWLLSDSIIYLIFVPGIIRGITWAGFNLSAGNFLYDNIRPEKRGRAISYYNLMTGLGIFFGSVIGAILIKTIKTDVLEPISIIFLISTIITIGVVYFWIPKIKEIKEISGSKEPKAFRKFLLKTIRPTISEETHEIVTMKKYFSVK